MIIRVAFVFCQLLAMSSDWVQIVKTVKMTALCAKHTWTLYIDFLVQLRVFSKRLSKEQVHFKISMFGIVKIKTNEFLLMNVILSVKVVAFKRVWNANKEYTRIKQPGTHTHKPSRKQPVLKRSSKHHHPQDKSLSLLNTLNGQNWWIHEMPRWAAVCTFLNLLGLLEDTRREQGLICIFEVLLFCHTFWRLAESYWWCWWPGLSGLRMQETRGWSWGEMKRVNRHPSKMG